MDISKRSRCYDENLEKYTCQVLTKKNQYCSCYLKDYVEGKELIPKKREEKQHLVKRKRKISLKVLIQILWSCSE
jgi:hypothetical protein